MTSNEYWRKRSSSYDALAEFTKIRKRAIDFLAKNLTENDLNGIVCDLGAGTGMLGLRLRELYPNTKLLLIDLSLDMLTKAASKFHCNSVLFATADLANDFPTDLLNNFNISAFVSSFLFHHLNEKQSVLENLSKVMQFGTRLVFVDEMSFEEEFDLLRHKRNMKRQFYYDLSEKDFTSEILIHPQYPITAKKYVELLTRTGFEVSRTKKLGRIVGYIEATKK